MKISVIRPSSTRYRFSFEIGDEIHHRCTWADIDLDHETYTLTACTDCGNYAYGWTPTPKAESFRALMARINGEYLLGKISDTSVFDFEASKQQLIKEAKECACTLDQQWSLEDLENMDECGEELFLFRAAEITGLDYASIPIVKEYPAGAVTFAKLFVEYLQPILREELKQ